MAPIERDGSVRCCVGLHAYVPDVRAGYPYQQCRRCDRLDIYRPSRLTHLRLCALLRQI